MERVRVTESDLLEALRDAFASAEASEDALTTADLVEACGRGEETVRKALRALERKGQLEVVRVRRRRLDGQIQVYPAYRLRAA